MTKTSMRGAAAKFLAAIALAALSAAGLATPAVATSEPSPTRAYAAALSGSSFDAGYIISDYAMYNRNALTQPEIQAFLDAKIGTCNNSNCLNIKRTTTFNRAADRTVCAAYTGAANELTSTILFKVQQACGISAKVLLVMLQKEQSLVSAKSPSDSTLGRAMGYACPDNNGGVCDAQFYGLYNQIYKAAWQLKRYSTPDPWGSYQPGVNNIQYHPSTSCGTQRVVIRNNGTAALYNYTPYVPNAAALANLGGTGNSCSSYGNRNFWSYYNGWFGSAVTTIPPGVTVERIGGSDRYGTSVGLSTASFAPNVPILYIASGIGYPDALSAGAAASKQGVPLLIVDPDFVPASVLAEIARLNPTKIVIVGGAGAVSESVQAELAGLCDEIERVDGENRYVVSRALALSAFGEGGSDYVYLADGRNFPDALSAGGAAAKRSAPVILIDGSLPEIDAETIATLQLLGVTKVIIAGGQAAVSSGIESSLASTFATVTRLGGATRYATAGSINRDAFGDADTVYVAVGTNFPDALSGVPVAALTGSPLYIVESSCIPSFVLDDFLRFGITKMVILGGTGSMTSQIDQFTGC